MSPLWKDKERKKKKLLIQLFVATPVHSDCSIHYTQALLELQKVCFRKGVETNFV